MWDTYGRKAKFLCVQIGKWGAHTHDRADQCHELQICGLLLAGSSSRGTGPNSIKYVRVGVFCLLILSTWPNEPSYNYYGEVGQDSTEGWKWRDLIVA